jgi:hypothetical protein
MSVKSRLLRLEKKAGIGDVHIIRTLADLMRHAYDNPGTDKDVREYRLSPQLAALVEEANKEPESNRNG